MNKFSLSSFLDKFVLFPGNRVYAGPGEARPPNSLPAQTDNYEYDTFIIESQIPYIDTRGKSLIIRSSQQDIEFRIDGSKMYLRSSFSS